MRRLLRAYRYIPGFRRLKRAWRSRGFGIHSPFAFRFVTCVLREKGEYYAYPALRRLAGKGRRFRSIALIFRLVCEFRPRFVVVSGERNRNEVALAVALADSGVQTVGSLPEDLPASVPVIFVSLSGDEAGRLAHLAGIQERRAVGVWIDVPRGVRQSLKMNLRSGMTFAGSRMFIAVCRPDLPRQDFEINF
ncbi:MAG: hypothetical protein HDS17_07740 [Bacteroides sp.]|nr:hypothetical protein [Bacteroides sp.]